MAMQKPRITAGATRHRSRTGETCSSQNTQRYVMIAMLAVASFFGAYKYAQAQSSASVPSPASVASANGVVPAGGTAAVPSGGGASGGGGCCGGGGAPTTGAATVQGGVQKINVDASSGYNPNTIQLKSGVPTEITFSQSSGCTAIVQSSDLGFQEDLSAGPKTVKLKALQPGTYNFACGMNMVRGTIVVS